MGVEFQDVKKLIHAINQLLDELELEFILYLMQFGEKYASTVEKKN